MVASFGTQVHLNCSVTEGNKAIWVLELPGVRAPVATDEPGVFEALMNRGILVEVGADHTTSILTVNATMENNETIISCIAINTTNPTLRFESREVQIIFGKIT